MLPIYHQIATKKRPGEFYYMQNFLQKVNFFIKVRAFIHGSFNQNADCGDQAPRTYTKNSTWNSSYFLSPMIRFTKSITFRLFIIRELLLQHLIEHLSDTPFPWFRCARVYEITVEPLPDFLIGSRPDRTRHQKQHQRATATEPM